MSGKEPRKSRNRPPAALLCLGIPSSQTARPRSARTHRHAGTQLHICTLVQAHTCTHIRGHMHTCKQRAHMHTERAVLFIEFPPLRERLEAKQNLPHLGAGATYRCSYAEQKGCPMREPRSFLNTKTAPTVQLSLQLTLI